MKRIAVDVGGTFIDYVLWMEEEQTMSVHKRPSTPSEPAEGIIDGLQTLCTQDGLELDELDQVLHGTTVGTNIVLERKGANVGLLTTNGFKDVLHIARGRRPLNFTLRPELPWQAHPLVKRQNRREITERVSGPAAEVIEPLDENDVREQVRQLRANGVDAVAICFLFSFLNPAHEVRAQEILEEEWPGVWSSISSEVIPKMREYERFSTTCLDAYIGPKVSAYVEALESRLRAQGYRGRLHLMTSGGGLATRETASSRPATLLFSGAVGGLLGGIWVGKSVGHSSVITLDVGGTSADIGVAPYGETRLKHVTEATIGGHSSLLPMVDVDCIGAGGGSIAHVSENGLFSVGPTSAGADPGPACYGRGGVKPTVTDAAVVAGILGPDRPLGGSVRLQSALAETAIDQYIGQPLNLGLDEAACGVLSLLVHNMVQAIELSSIRKGYDPRDFVLVPIGGAGPMFGVAIARELSIPRVIVPPHPGLAAAMGLLVTDVVSDIARPVFGRLTELRHEDLSDIYDELALHANAEFAVSEIEGDRRRVVRYVECRFVGQAYELQVPVESGPITAEWMEDVARRFEAAHQAQLGRFAPSSEVELVTVGVKAIGLMPEVQAPELDHVTSDADAARTGSRNVLFTQASTGTYSVEAPLYDRGQLVAGHVINGPAVIEQFDTTILLDPESTGRVDQRANLVIEL